MFLPIREGIAEVLHELQELRQDTEYMEGWTRSFEYQLGRAVERNVKLARTQSVMRYEDCQTVPERVVSSNRTYENGPESRPRAKV